MITNISELEDPFPEEIEEETSVINITINYSEKIDNNKTNYEEEYENVTYKSIININGTKDTDLNIDDNSTKEKTDFSSDNVIPIGKNNETHSVEGKADIMEKHSLLLVFLLFLNLI